MVSYSMLMNLGVRQILVLILVVVDDGLVLLADMIDKLINTVLILVVVDDGLVHLALRQVSMGAAVLILVVVDDGLVLYSLSIMVALWMS